MTEITIAFTFGVVVGAFVSGIAFGGAYLGLVVKKAQTQRRGSW